MKLVTGKQMAEIDRQSIEEIGIPGVVLMERAGLKVAEAVKEELATTEAKVMIMAGRGNNGGDGFVVARLLAEAGYKVETVLLGTKDDISGDARVNLDSLVNLGYSVKEVTSEAEITVLKSRLSRTDIVVDALLGTGIKGNLRGLFPQLIQLINQVATKVVAVDIPSGVEAATGKVKDVAIQAARTVTFGLAKLGLVLYPGANYTGNLEVVEIGLPQRVVESVQGKAELLTPEQVAPLLPDRQANSHKGSYGKLLVVAGSTGMTGAATLTSKASLRSGAGLVTVGVPASLNTILEEKLTAAMTYPLADQAGQLTKKALPEIKDLAKSRDVVAVGPGLGSGEELTYLVHQLIDQLEQPLVLDADGLNAIDDLSLLKKRRAATILTPHPGELARLLDQSIESITESRLQVAQEFATEYQVCLVLKGSRTVIATPEGRLYINSTGNSGLATGGSGDILTGLIAGFLGQGLEEVDAVRLAVYLHGLTADLAVEDLTEYSLVPTDLVEYLPQGIKQLRRDVNESY
ncbi:NAD(P)H-hydrate dehydratase [Halanaerobaculum tunisiense]